MDKIIVKKIEAEAEEVVRRIIDEPDGAIRLFNELLWAFEEKEERMAKREGNLWHVLKNLKPEHLEEMKKLIAPEVFESLGL